MLSIRRNPSYRRRVQPARWGLVNRWARRAPQCINTKPKRLSSTFREAFQQRCCVLPDGFNEGPALARLPATLAAYAQFRREHPWSSDIH
jgi:putative SOS response-associated peptidase YedK